MDSPIFIGGIAGTGKTRLGSLLGRHPHIVVTRKTYLWRRFYGRYGDLSDTQNLERCSAAVLASPGVQELHIDNHRFRSEMAGRPQTYEELFALVHRLHAEAAGKARWCDQLGLVEVYAKVVFSAFPKAKMIQMVRDPRCARIADRGPAALGWAIGKWMTSVELAERNSILFPNNYFVLRHEDLEADEEQTLRTICSFLDEPFDRSMMAAPALNGEPSAGRFRASSDRFVETCARDLMFSQGYAVEGGRHTKSVRYRLVDWPANRLALAVWRRVRVRSLAKQVGGIR